MPSSFSVSLNSPQNARQIFFKIPQRHDQHQSQHQQQREHKVIPRRAVHRRTAQPQQPERNKPERHKPDVDNRSMMTVASAKPMPLFILRPV